MLRPRPVSVRTMRTATTVVLLASVALLSGCATGPGDGPSADPAAAPPPGTTIPGATIPGTTSDLTPTATTPSATTAAAAPPPPDPAVRGDCPYLSAADVAQLNGERVGEVLLDPASNPPACAFTRAGGDEQLQVWVLRAESPEVATAAVDRAAPVDSTDPVEQPAGWVGGSSGGPEGGVYAVSKGPVAVVVTTDQAQSVKARRVTELVISSLGL